MASNDDFLKKQKKQAEEWKTDVILLKSKQHEMHLSIEESSRIHFILIKPKLQTASKTLLQFGPVIKDKPDEPG